MKKFKLLISIFFVLAFQVSFSTSRSELEANSMTMSVESEKQTHFEANHFSPNIFGEVASGQGSITLMVSVTKSSFSDSNTNDLQIGFTQGILRATKVLQNTQHLGLATYCLLLIPSYLQTGNLQI